jgi:predicted transcriptional regulator
MRTPSALLDRLRCRECRPGEEECPDHEGIDEAFTIGREWAEVTALDLLTTGMVPAWPWPARRDLSALRAKDLGSGVTRWALVTAGECMTASAIVISPRESITTAAAVMRSSGARYLPVIEHRDPIGVPSARDVQLAATLRPDLEVRRVMTPDPSTFLWGTPVRHVTAHLAQTREECAVVLQDTDVVGVLTVADAVARVLDGLHAGATSFTRVP